MFPKINCPFFFSLALLISFKLFAQTPEDLNNFKGIKSEGKIPIEFREKWFDRFHKIVDDEDLEFENRLERKLFADFWATSSYEINQILQSGVVSFGDPATIYLNKIKDEILKDEPELAKKVKIYLVKSPVVNAFASQQGIIFVNSGLVARAQTEADLAFVLCHEIIHFRDDHVLKSYYSSDSIDEKRGNYGGLYSLEQIDIMLGKRKKNEFSADRLGLELFLNSPYNSKGISNTLNLLHNNYIPWKEEKLSDEFLQVSGKKIPSFFFKSKVDPIDREEDYFDQTHSHPNIYKRRKILDSLIAQEGVDSSKSLFVFGENYFNEIRTLCQFETINQEIKRSFFGDALYNIAILKKDFPENSFLDRALAKSLYGLSIYKLYDNYPAVGRSYTKTEGESQQVHYLLRQLSARQFSSLALAHIYSLSKKHPEQDVYVNMLDELTLAMVIRTNLESTDFLADGKIKKFRKQEPDFDSKNEWIRAGQVHYKEFYKYLLTEAVSDNWLSSNFKNHLYARDSILKEQRMKAKYKRKRERKKRRNIIRHGAGLDLDKVIVLDPIYYAPKDQSVRSFEKTEKRKKKWLKKINKTAAKANVDIEYLAVHELKESDVDQINRLSSIRDFLIESQPYRSSDLSLAESEACYEKNPITENRYAAIIQIEDLKSIYSAKKYYFKLVDLSTGEIMYQNEDKKWFILNKYRLKLELKRDLKRISKTW